jgi:hypothetical protein
MIRGGGDTVRVVNRGALELCSGILAATGTSPGDRLEFEEGGPA